MLYLFHGTDEHKNSKQFYKLANSLRAKRQDVLVFKIDEETFDPSKLEEIISGNSLFDPKYLILLQGLSAFTDGRDWFKANLKKLAEIDHIVLVLEKEIPKELLTVFKKYAEKITVHDKLQETISTRFNIFSLADALGERDRKKLWVLYQQALYAGIPAEEVFWRFVGQVKNMLLVARAKDSTAIKMHPFVLKKTLSASKRFSVDELKNLSKDLLTLYYDARHGRREIKVGLERTILGL